jgi:hypothetical protein
LRKSFEVLFGLQCSKKDSKKLFMHTAVNLLYVDSLNIDGKSYLKLLVVCF